MGTRFETEAEGNSEMSTVFSRISTAVLILGHTINFENAHVINKGNSRVRKTLESGHTAITSQADNIVILSTLLAFSFHRSISVVLLCLFVFVLYFLTFLYIYIFTFAFYISLFKDCRLAIESSVFLNY